MMPFKIGLAIAATVLVASAVVLYAGDAQAGHHQQKPLRYQPRSPHAPYYYSRWNPYSAYSVYDHLSGGRQLCYLPTDPCDNNHRMHN
jgi:hypothetical protein